MAAYKSKREVKLEAEARSAAREALAVLSLPGDREEGLFGVLAEFAQKAVTSDRRSRRESELMRAAFSYKGRDLFIEEKAVEQLLSMGELVVFFTELKDDEYRQGRSAMTPALLCSDLFAWGCADAEEIESEAELLALYDAVREDLSWGSTRWVCKKRNEQPQRPVKESMVESGAWDAEMEALPENAYDRHRREKYGEAA